MTAVSFDSDFDTMGKLDYRFTMQAIEDSNVRLGVLLQAPELSFGKLDRKLFPKAFAGRYRFVNFIRMVLGKRLSVSKVVSRDIFSFLQECKDPHTGKELSTAELSTETATFIVAGKPLCPCCFLTYNRIKSDSLQEPTRPQPACLVCRITLRGLRVATSGRQRKCEAHLLL